MFLLDTHMHFDLYKDRTNLLGQIESNCSYTICVTTLPKLFEKYNKQYDWSKYKYCRLALGLHPELAKEYENQIETFIRLLPFTRYVGEVGLDFSISTCDSKEVQLKVFQRIIQECNKYGNKILSVHTRNSTSETLKIMENFSGRVILHWYSGTFKDLNEAIKRGYYFSINHQMLNSVKGRKIIDAIPIQRILIESDAPFTIGMKEKYSIDFVDEILEYLTDSRDINKSEVSNFIKSNFRNLLL